MIKMGDSNVISSHQGMPLEATSISSLSKEQLQSPYISEVMIPPKVTRTYSRKHKFLSTSKITKRQSCAANSPSNRTRKAVTILASNAVHASQKSKAACEPPTRNACSPPADHSGEGGIGHTVTSLSPRLPSCSQIAGDLSREWSEKGKKRRAPVDGLVLVPGLMPVLHPPHFIEVRRELTMIDDVPVISLLNHMDGSS